MGKSCDECKHDEKSALEAPCSRCYRYEQFEQKEVIDPKPSKTLLDEFAMAAMSQLVGLGAFIKDSGRESLCCGAYDFAAAMMKERARRDEMGNVKEVE